MKIIIAGAYAIGNYLASLLTRTNEDITIIDDNVKHSTTSTQTLTY